MKINRGDFGYDQFMSEFYFAIYSRLVAFSFLTMFSAEHLNALFFE